MDVGTIISLLGVLGLGGILTKLVEAATSRRRERRAEERATQDELDREARARRVLEEALHETRRRFFRTGAVEGDGPTDVPRWPSYTLHPPK